MIRPVRVGQIISESWRVDIETATEIARVGAVPCERLDSIGKEVWLHGQKFVCLDEISRAEFMNVVESAGLGYLPFDKVPTHYKFQRVSTD